MDNNLLKSGFFCLLCNCQRMTKEESEIHKASIIHIKNKKNMDRSIREDEIKEEDDKKMLDYLSFIDPLE